MPKETKEIKVNEPTKPMVVAEFEAFLEEYKKSNPAKYAIKLANGEFEKYKKTLGK